MRIQTLVIATFITISFFSQPYQIGHRQQSFIDPSRNNRNITTEIYYPANTNGDNVPVSAGQFPVLVFGHGFVMTWSAYDVVWNALVPEGYIMVFPTTETSFSPSHSDFGKDIAFLIGAMKNESLNAGSPFFNSNSGTSAAMGHSMGGGSAFLAIQYDNTITALATLAAANTTPPSISAASSIIIPSLVISGGNDCVTPPSQHQIPMYDSLNSGCKSFVSITGGSHCQFANYNFNCYFGEGTCSPQATVSAVSQQATVKNVLIPWLDFYLKGSCPSGTQFQNLINTGNGITSQQNCILACNELNQTSFQDKVVLYPNPSDDEVFFINTSPNNEETKLIIENQMGEQIQTIIQENSHETRIVTNEFSNGAYLIKIYQKNQLIVQKKWIVSKK